MKSASASKALIVIVAVSSAGAIAADPQSPDAAPTSVETLEQKVDTMSKQLEELKAQLRELKSQSAVPGAAQPGQAPEPAEAKAPQPVQAKAEPSPQAPAAQQPAPPELSRWDKVSLWGYGEIYYMRPTQDASQTTADLARAVFGIGYQFNENTRFNSEFEWEHAVTSADDAGEVEVEQFYVDHTINTWASFQAGLFLMPAGLLNEHHEPTNFYGVQRNFVETLIIPTTWREGGVAFKAVTQNGFTGTVGITTGLDFSKWEFNPSEPLYNDAFQLEFNNAAPMQATHQELSVANAQHLSGFASLNYTGVLGLLVGG
ncbi:MAG TPA: porin, partial [Burkholderiales bacterium]|nr:porin [Burkholderiales bacterium]